MQKIMTRIPEEVYEALRKMAYETRESMNSLTLRALQEFLRREQKKEERK